MGKTFICNKTNLFESLHLLVYCEDDTEYRIQRTKIFPYNCFDEAENEVQ